MNPSAAVGRVVDPAARARGAFVIALLVAFAQVGPAVACDLFDGSGKDGCPPEFYSTDLIGAGQPLHSSGDCSHGPTFLQGDSAASKPAQCDGSDPQALSAPQILVAPAASVIATEVNRAYAPRTNGNRIYLKTRRLRI